MQNQTANLFRTGKAAGLAVAALFIFSGIAAPPARAANKDMIQLQVQVQQLQDAVARLQQSNDERMGVMKDLVQQSADSVNKMSATIDAVQLQIKNQQDAEGAKIDQVSGQIQSLNDSLDEIKARLGRLEKIMQDVQSQQQSISANVQSAVPAAGSALPPGTESPMTASPASPAVDSTPTGRRGKPSAGTPLAAAPAAPLAPPVDDLYKTALGDYMSAKYTLADSEFGDVIHFYSDNPLAGNAYYYRAEIAYRGGHYDDAIKAYDNVITKYPASNKVPVSRLHKGQALIALKQRDAGIRELRALIQRFPNSPEAMQARSRLSGMGVPVTPRR